MAEDLFAGLPEPGKGQKADDLFAGLPEPGKAPKPDIRQNPISGWERFVMKNLFDTQTKRREAYAKKIGIELDPQDHDKYRMAGVPKDTPYDQAIDPSGMDWGDATDVVGDIVSGIGSGLAAGAGFMGGAVLGGLAGSAAGPVGIVPGLAVGGLGGEFTGGAAGYAGIEKLKKAAGDWVMDTPDDIPLDKQELWQQSLIAGAIPLAGAVLKQGGLAAMKAYGNLRFSALKNIIREGGEMTKNVFAKLIQKPQLFTEEATQGGGKKLAEEFVQWFGKAPPEGATEEELKGFINRVKQMGPKDFSPDTLAGKLLQPVKQQQEALLDALSQNRAADVSGSQLLNRIDGKIAELSGIRGEGTTTNGLDALQLLKAGKDRMLGVLRGKNPNIQAIEAQLEQVQKATPHDVTTLSKLKNQLQAEINNTKVDFGTARDQIDLMQQDVYGAANKAKTNINGIVSKTLGETKGVLDDITNLPNMPRIEDKSFADVNADLTKKLQATKDMMTEVTPQKMIGQAVKGHQVGAQDTAAAMQNFDKAFGTNMQQAWESGALQAHMEDIYQKGSSLGEKQAKQVSSLMRPINAGYNLAMTGLPGKEVEKLSATQQMLDRLYAPPSIEGMALGTARDTAIASPFVQNALSGMHNSESQNESDAKIEAYLQQLREEQRQEDLLRQQQQQEDGQ